MECHKCQYTAAVQAGVYAGRPFEETPCAACDQPDGRAQPNSIRFHPGVDVGVSEPEAGVEEVMPVSVLADTVRLFLALPPDAMEIVRLRYAGKRFCEIALALHRRRKTVEMILYRTLEKHPALAELMPRPAKTRARLVAKEIARVNSRRAKLKTLPKAAAGNSTSARL